MTINLEKELLKHSEKREKKEQMFLIDSPEAIEYNKHLESDNSDILNRFGTSQVLRQIKDTIKKKDGLEKYSPETRKNIFTTEDIKKICIDYRLRFLSIKLYKGTIDADVPMKMKVFEESELFKNIDTFKIKYNSGNSWISNAYYPGKYHIVAPAESFELREKNLDPLLFCYLGDDLWYMICKWGNDLSSYRRIYSYFCEKHNLILSTIMIIISSFILHKMFLYQIPNIFLEILPLFGINFIGWAVTMMLFDDSTLWTSSENIWDKDIKE